MRVVAIKSTEAEENESLVTYWIAKKLAENYDGSVKVTLPPRAYFSSNYVNLMIDVHIKHPSGFNFKIIMEGMEDARRVYPRLRQLEVKLTTTTWKKFTPSQTTNAIQVSSLDEAIVLAQQEATDYLRVWGKDLTYFVDLVSKVGKIASTMARRIGMKLLREFPLTIERQILHYVVMLGAEFNPALKVFIMSESGGRAFEDNYAIEKYTQTYDVQLDEVNKRLSYVVEYKLYLPTNESLQPFVECNACAQVEEPRHPINLQIARKEYKVTVPGDASPQSVETLADSIYEFFVTSTPKLMQALLKHMGIWDVYNQQRREERLAKKQPPSRNDVTQYICNAILTSFYLLIKYTFVKHFGGYLVMPYPSYAVVSEGENEASHKVYFTDEWSGVWTEEEYINSVRLTFPAIMLIIDYAADESVPTVRSVRVSQQFRDYETTLFEGNYPVRNARDLNSFVNLLVNRLFEINKTEGIITWHAFHAILTNPRARADLLRIRNEVS